ncbi:uncharacterized protein [Linepithema humile]|uniref:uncharacterized protein n=1 Tax=Linepithema humile TaxID=83485 RepID=UPI0006238794|nr:PREDICTED: uncharacterized protein LOC105671877 [Linepithema humile]
MENNCKKESDNTGKCFTNTSEYSDEFDCVTNQYREFIKLCKKELDNDKLPKNFDNWAITEQYDHLISNASKYFTNIPESLRFILPAVFEDGDCGRPADERPEWLDMDKFRRGQEFALRYFSMLSISMLMGLLEVFVFTDGLKVLILSQKSNTPYRAFQRYLSTISRFRNWYTSDPWCPGTQAYRDIQAVRRMHRSMRRKLCSMDDKTFQETSKVPNSHCPVMGAIATEFANTCPRTKNMQCPYTMMQMRAINQGDMSGTQFACMGLTVLYPEKFGVHVSEEDLEAFCHLWRGLGYLLGIEDHYNFCRGTLPEVRKRAEDFVEHWMKPNFRTLTLEWQHMTKCLFQGIGSIIYFNNYKLILMRLCDIYKLDMSGLYKTFSPLEKIMYALMKFLLAYLILLPGVLFVMNSIVHVSLDQASKSEARKQGERLLKRQPSKMVSKFSLIL